MIRVQLESPFMGKGATLKERELETKKNVAYARAAMRDAIKRGETPFASHLLYTQPGVLDDNIPAERSLGIDAGFAWRSAAAKTVVYQDRGLSTGMCHGVADAVALIARQMNARHIALHVIEYRNIGGSYDADLDRWIPA